MKPEDFVRFAIAVVLASVVAGAFVNPLHAAEAGETAVIEWRDWSSHVFEDARKEHRLVLLDLGTRWCHWCHVMDDITYRDEAVIGLIRRKYLAVRVDADSRPDLAARYEDYGWPATIVFTEEGKELAKRQGYMPPRPMASMLQAFVDNPTPGPSVQPEVPLTAAKSSELTGEQLKSLNELLVSEYDPKYLGWGTVHKFLDWDILEYSMNRAATGDHAWERRARETLNSQLKLVDPVWGGVYQYSTDGDWEHPHFEKIMQFQAEDLRIYALAYARWKDPHYLEAARAIHRFLLRFLRDESGAFYTSQDADLVQGEHAGEYFALNDAQRVAKGVPRVDKHIYARENFLAISGLTSLHDATGDDASLAEALQAARWILAHRSLGDGSFRHDEHDAAGPYLGDTVYAARAFLCLYESTADRVWLKRSAEAMHAADTRFKGEVGYLSSAPMAGLKSRPQYDENVTLARTATRLRYYTGVDEFRHMAEHAMRYLASPAVAEGRGFQVAGILLADEELSKEPAHITIVGHKDDPAAQALFAAALSRPAGYRRIEWWDKREGPLPNPDVTYPEMPKAAAFVCKEGSCSAPVYAVEKLTKLW